MGLRDRPAGNPGAKGRGEPDSHRRGRQPRDAERRPQPRNGSLADVAQKDGLSVSDAGLIKTYPMLVNGKTIMVDADARQGEIRASIETFDGSVPEGYAKEDSDVISGKECIEAPIQFRGGSLDRFAGQPVRIVFHVTRGTRLFAVGVK